MTKFKLTAAIAVLSLGVPALAGEITGNGKSTPIRSGVASSECAFSGLNDDPGLDGFGMIQNYGMLVKAFGGFEPGFMFHPGVACRGR